MHKAYAIRKLLYGLCVCTKTCVDVCYGALSDSILSANIPDVVLSL